MRGLARRISWLRLHPTLAAAIVFIAISVAGCDDERPSTSMDDDDSDVFGDIAETGPRDDNGSSGLPDRGSVPDSGSDSDVVENPCSTHSDCPCPEGICISTGVCWCPPCETDEDCWDGLSCRSGVCAEMPAECIGPPRIRPDHGPTTGGTIIFVEGMEFYIGALEWWGQIGDGPGLRPIYGVDLGITECGMAFYSPPMEAGTYPVSVWYGGYPSYGDESRGADPAGHFTYEESDDVVGHRFCRSHAQCDTPLEACDLGMGRCVPNLCLSVFCSEGACDPVEGCVRETDLCEDDEDCRLLHSSCTCDAVGASDPREELDQCYLGGCDSCDENHCETELIVAACTGGQCTERRSDPEGQPCRSLSFTEFDDKLEAGTWIHGIDSTVGGDQVALAWTAPTEASYRYGVIGLALLDPSAPGNGSVQQIDVPDGMDSNPAVAWDGEQYGLIWLNERRPMSLLFQAVDTSGRLISSPVVVDERIDTAIVPSLFGNDGGFDAFWAQQDWGEEDGLYHAVLSSDGTIVGDVDFLDWVVPSLESFSVHPYQDHFLIAWPNSLYGREGLFVSHFPLSDAPIQLVAEAGAGVAITANAVSYTLAWRDNSDSMARSIPLQLRSYDRDDVPLIPPVLVSSYGVSTLGAEVSYLGGIYLVSWYEWDNATNTSRLVFDLVRDDGRQVDGDPPVAFDDLERPAQFHQRIDDRILVGWVEPTGSKDGLRFGVWECVP